MISKVVPSGRGLSIAQRDWADPCDYPKLGWLERIIFDSGDERSRRPCTVKWKIIAKSSAHSYLSWNYSALSLQTNSQSIGRKKQTKLKHSTNSITDARFLFDSRFVEGRDYPLSPLSKITRSTHSMRASAGVNPHRSAMVRSRPGRTSFLINVTSAPSKFKWKCCRNK